MKTPALSSSYPTQALADLIFTIILHRASFGVRELLINHNHHSLLAKIDIDHQITPADLMRLTLIVQASGHSFAFKPHPYLVCIAPQQVFYLHRAYSHSTSN